MRYTQMCAGVVIAAGGVAFGGTVPATVILAEGDSVNGGVVTITNPPFTDSTGKVGFVGGIELGDGSTDRFVWYDGGPVFFGNDVMPEVLTGGEGTMDVSDSGGFLYSPSIDGEDGAWSHLGKILRETETAPGFDAQFISFASRPRMRPDGTMYVVAGITTDQGGSTQNRVFYEVSADGSSYTPLYIGGASMVDGQTIVGNSGIDFDYSFSDDGSSLINVFEFTSGLQGVVVNDSNVLGEGDPVGDGSGEVFDSLDLVGVNNAGTWFVTGDTDGDSDFDEYIAIDGEIGLRSGDTVAGGFQITPGASFRSASINDDGVVATVWGAGFGSGATEFLLAGMADDLAGSQLVLQLGDELDTDGDEVGDVVVVDFEGSTVTGPTLDLQEDGFINIELELEPVGGGEAFTAVVRLDSPFGAPCPGDFDGDDDVDSDDLNLILGGFGDAFTSEELNEVLGNFGEVCE